MANIFNREIDNVTVTYDSEMKNKLGVDAIATDAKMAMGRQAVYTFDVASGVIAFVKLNDDTVAELGEAETLAGGKTLVKISDNLFYFVEASKLGWTELKKPIELTFKNKGKIKLDVIDATAEA